MNHRLVCTLHRTIAEVEARREAAHGEPAARDERLLRNLRSDLVATLGWIDELETMQRAVEWPPRPELLELRPVDRTLGAKTA